MHAVFLTRGNVDAVNSVNEFLKTQKFLLPITKKDGTQIHLPIAGNLQPIQLWSYVFPKEYKDPVLTTLGFTKENMERWYHSDKDLKQKLIWLSLQKALHLDPIPKDIKTDKQLWLDIDAKGVISFMPIGIKHDIVSTDENGDTYERI